MCRWAARGRPGGGECRPTGPGREFRAPGAGRGTARLRRAGMHPPFFFVLPKKNAPCTVEEKDAWAQNRRQKAPFLLKCGGRANPCGRNLLGFRRVRRTAQEQRTCSPAFGTAQRLSGVVIVRALPLAPRVPLRYALPRPFSGRVSKGEGPQPRPFEPFQGGVGETGEAPPAADEASLFRGSGAIGGPEKGPGIAMPRRC